ncbi:HAMP domain-containing sensor histidine kinase [Tsukamurella sp. 8F]|uniref:HAMP domain-containing sensor histidine kinase n=1 Tax=unclassified Tsukamurella TaxID=2633480 RepID=UPI0023B90E8A|nr:MULTISPECIES: HAMP domain-containing sensor histidine kinase [unclassified Tsukamurella]MDF0529338.1 HAMP domain-containing sensor histidine kinase [Tsukamurella sp. 8J]MDF0587155.1 HAMP domain-containing sensor histidine kinase [Tsukamurella sp. 8F]
MTALPRLLTVSLRGRVLVTTLSALALALVIVVVVVAALFESVVHREVSEELRARVGYAETLARTVATPQEFVRRVDVRLITAQVTMPDGEVIGEHRRLRGEREVQTRDFVLHGGRLDGARVTLTVDSQPLQVVKSRLLWGMVATALATLAVTGLLLAVAVRRALAPLDAITRLARDTEAGNRGGRLLPDRPDTELGRAANAFDDMLDSIESAESHAREANDRVRRFVADAAHELRTPITGMRAMAQALLQRSQDTDAAERERLSVILVQESNRAGRIVGDLVDLARIDASIPLDLDLAEADLYELASAQVERSRLVHAGLVLELRGGGAVAMVDAARVSQILANLVDNACQATPEGGRVVVTVGAAGEMAEVHVVDTGTGIPAADRERVFDRLVRLDASRRIGGAGLGLAIARGLARAHGGDLTCNEPPAGFATDFRLVLPIRR